MNKVAALVLAGGNVAGYGVMTQNRAKAALTFAGHYRVCDFVLTNLAVSGAARVGLLIQYLPGSLMTHVGTGEWWELTGGERYFKIMPPFMGYGRTNWFRGTGDSVFRNLDFVEDSDAEHVLVLSCEHVYHMDFRPFLQYHIDTGSAMTLVVTQLPSGRLTRRFGYPEVDRKSGRIVKMIEKPEKPLGSTVFTGIVLFRRDVLVRKLLENAEIPGADNLTYHVIVPLIDQADCYAYEHKGYWEYLENLGNYYDVHMDLARGDSPIRLDEWDVLTNLAYRRLGSLQPTVYEPSAQVQDSLISPGARIAGKVTRSVISPGVVVQEGAVVEDSILWHDCLVGAGARLNRVISDRDCVFGPECVLGKEDEAPRGLNPELPENHRQLVVVGKASRIAPGLTLGPATQLYPATDTEAMELSGIVPAGQNLKGRGPRWPASESVKPMVRMKASKDGE
jgi:glucose-1-phosphate adenylyltransferase